METLIYVGLLILYLIFQGSMIRRKQQKAREQNQEPGETGADTQRPSPVRDIEERMKEIFREMEMKSKPYAKQEKRPVPKLPSTSTQKTQKSIPKIQKKKEPTPFLNVDMTTEELLPEGTPSKMATDVYFHEGIAGYDYNAKDKPSSAHKINLREAIIANVILNRREW